MPSRLMNRNREHVFATRVGKMYCSDGCCCELSDVRVDPSKIMPVNLFDLGTDRQTPPRSPKHVNSA